MSWTLECMKTRGDIKNALLSAPDNWASLIVGLIMELQKLWTYVGLLCPLKWLWWQRVAKTVRIRKIRLKCIKFLDKNFVSDCLNHYQKSYQWGLVGRIIFYLESAQMKGVKSIYFITQQYSRWSVYWNLRRSLFPNLLFSFHSYY